MIGVISKVKRNNRIGSKSKRQQRPHFRNGSVIGKIGITVVAHPVVVVLGGMIDRIVVTSKSKIYHRHANKLQKWREITSSTSSIEQWSLLSVFYPIFQNGLWCNGHLASTITATLLTTTATTVLCHVVTSSSSNFHLCCYFFHECRQLWRTLAVEMVTTSTSNINVEVGDSTVKQLVSV